MSITRPRRIRQVNRLTHDQRQQIADEIQHNLATYTGRTHLHMAEIINQILPFQVTKTNVRSVMHEMGLLRKQGSTAFRSSTPESRPGRKSWEPLAPSSPVHTDEYDLVEPGTNVPEEAPVNHEPDSGNGRLATIEQTIQRMERQLEQIHAEFF